MRHVQYLPFFFHLVLMSAACLVSVFALLLPLLESISCSIKGRTCTFSRTIKVSVHEQLSNAEDEKRKKNRGFLSLIIDLCSRNLSSFLVAVEHSTRFHLHEFFASEFTMSLY